LNLTPREREKGKNKLSGLHQIRKLLHSEGNHQQNEKATHQMGENICKSYIKNGLVSKIYEKLIQLNSKTNKNKNKQSS